LIADAGELAPVGPLSMSTVPLGEGCRVIPYVCFWHKADMLNAPTNVRFWG